MNGRYMAYIGSYPYTSRARGITMYDVDVEKDVSKEWRETEMDNSSYVATFSDGKTLYSIADEGMISFRIPQNRSLAGPNSSPVRGMRGCHLCMDVKDEYVFVSGYYDGKTTVLSLSKDGSVGEIVDEVYNKGYGSVAERNLRSHVTCTRRMSDGRYVLFVDNGTDQVKAYRFNDKDKRPVQVDVIHCDLESAPRYFHCNSDGRFLYLMYELRNVINVYSYETGDRAPVIEKIQTISTTTTKSPGSLTAAYVMRLSPDEKYIYRTNAGEDTVAIHRRDEGSGLLTTISCLPVGGKYPKGVAIFPDQKHTASINHDSGFISFFEVNYEEGLLAMYGRSISVNQSNYCITTRIDRSQQRT